MFKRLHFVCIAPYFRAEATYKLDYLERPSENG